jgi:hypothetical protein
MEPQHPGLNPQNPSENTWAWQRAADHFGYDIVNQQMWAAEQGGRGALQEQLNLYNAVLAAQAQQAYLAAQQPVVDRNVVRPAQSAIPPPMAQPETGPEPDPNSPEFDWLEGLIITVCVVGVIALLAGVGLIIFGFIRLFTGAPTPYPW